MSPSQDLKIDLRVKADPGICPAGSKITVNSTMIDKDLEQHIDKFIDQKEIIKHFIAYDINVYKDDQEIDGQRRKFDSPGEDSKNNNGKAKIV
jgi:adenine-specific DNA methylase